MDVITCDCQVGECCPSCDPWQSDSSTTAAAATIPRTYTLSDLNVLAMDFVSTNDASRDLGAPDALKLRIFMGMFLTWLRNSEKESNDEDNVLEFRMGGGG